jgi:hypothetical protein
MYIMMKFSKYTPNICQIMMDFKNGHGEVISILLQTTCKRKKVQLIKK